MVIIFNKDEHGTLVVPQPHFKIIHDVMHVTKDKAAFVRLWDIYPQLKEKHFKGKLAKSFEG